MRERLLNTRLEHRNFFLDLKSRDATRAALCISKGVRHWMAASRGIPSRPFVLSGEIRYGHDVEMDLHAFSTMKTCFLHTIIVGQFAVLLSAISRSLPIRDISATTPHFPLEVFAGFNFQAASGYVKAFGDVQGHCTAMDKTHLHTLSNSKDECHNV